MVPTKISCPLFEGQVFAGLRLTVPTAYISVVSGNSALLVFSFFFSFLILMHLYSYHSCALVPLLNMFSSYVSSGQLSRNRSLGGDISLVV